MMKTAEYNFSDFFNKQKGQKNSFYLKYKSFVTL